MKKLTLVFLFAAFISQIASASDCAPGMLVTLKWPHTNPRMQTVPAGTKAQLLVSTTRGYADVVLFLAGMTTESGESQCALQFKQTVLVGANLDSFQECEFKQ